MSENPLFDEKEFENLVSLYYRRLIKQDVTSELSKIEYKFSKQMKKDARAWARRQFASQARIAESFKEYISRSLLHSESKQQLFRYKKDLKTK